MAHSKLPRQIHSIMNVFFNHCPHCKTNALDRRHKGLIYSWSCHIRRWSKNTLVQECRICGLRYSLTWKSMKNCLTKMAGKSSKVGEIEMLKRQSLYLDYWIEELKK